MENIKVTTTSSEILFLVSNVIDLINGECGYNSGDIAGDFRDNCGRNCPSIPLDVVNIIIEQLEGNKIEDFSIKRGRSDFTLRELVKIGRLAANRLR